MFDLHIRDILRLQNIERWSIVETTRKQSVAEHSYNAAMITEAVMDALDEAGVTLGYADRYSAMKYCLCHDLSEVMTGDIPTPVKKWISGYAGVDPIEEIEKTLKPSVQLTELSYLAAYTVKFADLLEAVVFIGKYRADSHGERVHMELRDRLDEFVKGITQETIMGRKAAGAFYRVWHQAEHAEYTLWGSETV